MSALYQKKPVKFGVEFSERIGPSGLRSEHMDWKPRPVKLVFLDEKPAIDRSLVEKVIAMARSGYSTGHLMKADPARERVYLRKWREENKEKYLECARVSYAKNSEKAKQRFREHYKSNPDQRKAQRLVNKLVNNGTMVRQPCQICGNPTTDAHHDSYVEANWLKVTWFCVKHHRAWHRVFVPEVPGVNV